MANNEVTIPLPKYNLRDEDHKNVYPPSSDSFLLIDALEKDMHNIFKFKPLVCLEIGVGSGVVITALATALGDSCKYYGTDINPYACQKAKETGELNKVIINTVCCDLASGIPDELRKCIDILIFNPPYVVTPSNEIGAGSLEFTWAGGEKGREVVDRLFPDLPSLLSPKGVFYLLVEEQNKPEEIIKILCNLGYSSECIISRKIYNELLYVLKFYK